MVGKMIEILCRSFSIGLVQLMPENIIGFNLMIYINIGLLRKGIKAHMPLVPL